MGRSRQSSQGGAWNQQETVHGFIGSIKLEGKRVACRTTNKGLWSTRMYGITLSVRPSIVPNGWFNLTKQRALYEEEKRWAFHRRSWRKFSSCAGRRGHADKLVLPSFSFNLLQDN